jgi:hypothetical protein
MNILRVVVVFEFHDVEPDTDRSAQIVASIAESCETMQTGFDANDCWVSSTKFIEEPDHQEDCPAIDGFGCKCK